MIPLVGSGYRRPFRLILQADCNQQQIGCNGFFRSRSRQKKLTHVCSPLRLVLWKIRVTGMPRSDGRMVSYHNVLSYDGNVLQEGYQGRGQRMVIDDGDTRDNQPERKLSFPARFIPLNGPLILMLLPDALR